MNRSDLTEKSISTLNGLIETSKDGENGFRAAAERAQDPQLKSLLLEYAEDCGRAVRELQQCVSSNGGKPENSGSVSGKAHRGWMKLRTAVTDDDDAAVLQECERGEDYAKAQYQKALQAELPGEIRALVQKQFDGALRHHDRIRELRDRYAHTTE